MKELGERLKEERERKGLTLKEVAADTKINASTIESIEKADLDKLPAPPYLRGFVQTYARHLGMNVDEVMTQFFEFFGSTKPKTLRIEEGQEDNPAITAINEQFPLIKKVGIGLGILALIAVVLTLQKTIKKYESESINAERQKSIVTATLETPETSEINPIEPTEPETSKEVVQPEESVKPDSTVRKPSPVEPTQQAAPPAEPKPVAQVEKPKEEPKKEVEKTVAKPQGHELILEALDSLKVTYQIDGKTRKSKELKPEQVLTLKAASSINLNATDGGALNVIYNGKDYGVPGNLGESVELKFPK